MPELQVKMRTDEHPIGLGDGDEIGERADIAAAHLTARAVQRRVVAICALCALVGVALLAAAIVSAGLSTNDNAGRMIGTAADK